MSEFFLDHVAKAYRESGVLTEAVRDASFPVYKGDVVWLKGESGSGKSTILSICGLLTGVDSGRFVINHRNASGLPESERDRLRAMEIGFIFQAHNLVPYLTAQENVELVAHAPRARIVDVLSHLGLAKRMGYRVSHLSGGEQQRVAVARALVRNPSIMLADEPISGLDQDSAAIVLWCLADMADRGAAVLVASHQEAVGEIATRIVTMKDGVTTA